MAVHRFEVTPRTGAKDPRAEALVRDAASIGVELGSARVGRVYLVEASLDAGQIDRLAGDLLADPVRERSHVGASPAPEGAAIVEVHPLPGVMDPASQSVREAVKELTGADADVSTGWRYELDGLDAASAEALAKRLLANPVIHAVHTEPFSPSELPRGHEGSFEVRRVAIRELSDAELEVMSREAHLFLSLEEMRALRAEYQELGREPTDIELETLAQTWSEHCVHKTLKSRVTYRGDAGGIDWTGRPGVTVNADGSVEIDNMLRSTVAAATFELIDEGIDWALSVFVDNAGVVRLDDKWAVNIKVETHNHPSAIEPYGGAATGIGGCIRDVIGTGMSAKPICSTDVFCVAPPDTQDVPSGCINPRRVLGRVVEGVRDYGNRMGIPTVNGAVWFDDRYVGNPLVFCGCVGLLPADMASGAAKAGDLIVALGGRTGRDGIHGATFSSAELTDTHADEFSHAVQIGNAIEEKRVLDAILRARDAEGGPLFSGITDCGAGGFSSAVGEMGEKVGAEVHLERAPLKYAGLSYTEIWISEAQERMVLSVPEDRLEELRAICDEEHVELAVLGTFGVQGDHGPDLVLNFHGTEVGRMPMEFLHDGIPMPTREAVWIQQEAKPTKPEQFDNQRMLTDLLGHPNIASKHWIVRQYDHEVQGRTVVKPLVGPGGRGPGDASVIEPIPGSGVGIAVGCGLATNIGDPVAGGDPYQMALAAIDECVRNLVCVGADPDRIAILDNFCWPSCGKPENMGSLARACIGCYDGAKAFGTPFVSGKDSLNNQFTTEDGRTIEIPPTLLITGLGRVSDVNKSITMDAKRPGSALLLVGPACGTLGGSHAALLTGAGSSMPQVDVELGAHVARVVADAISAGHVLSAHDVSDGGLACAVAEMLIAGSSAGEPIGALIDDLGAAELFGESASRYLLEVDPERTAEFAELLGDIEHRRIGTLDTSGRLVGSGIDAGVEELAAVWRTPLDW